jgi:hypothetical protein
VVFFGCSDPENCPAPAFARALREGRVSRIICVSLEDNEVYIFRGERHTVADVQDLIGAMTGQASGKSLEACDHAGCFARRGKEEEEGWKG